MGWLDRLFGRGDEPRAPRAEPVAVGGGGQPAALSDEQAIERYRYMVRTAPPETVEQAHEEAFVKLTPEQRAQVLRGLAAVTPEPERAALASGGDDPKTLARLATRAELRDPGVMERTFGGRGMGMGGMMAGTILSSLAAGFVGSMIAQQFFDGIGDADLAAGGPGAEAVAGEPVDAGAGDFADGGMDIGGDFGGDI